MLPFYWKHFQCYYSPQSAIGHLVWRHGILHRLLREVCATLYATGKGVGGGGYKGTYIMHGVQQLGELEEALPGLARVVGCFSHWTPELFNVINPHLLECCLVLQTLFGNWERDKCLCHRHACDVRAAILFKMLTTQQWQKGLLYGNSAGSCL